MIDRAGLGWIELNLKARLPTPSQSALSSLFNCCILHWQFVATARMAGSKKKKGLKALSFRGRWYSSECGWTEEKERQKQICIKI
jgi:hypothetical protein